MTEEHDRLNSRSGPVGSEASMGSRPARSKIERVMLALGMKAMVRAWVTRDGMDHFDRACYGGVSVEDAVAHYSDAIKAAQRRNPSIKVGRADVVDFLTGESHRVEGGDPR